MRHTAGLALAAAAFAAAGCLPRPKAQREVRLYDFGPEAERPAARGPAAVTIPASIVVRPPDAPLWLDVPSIHYRLGYDEPARIRSYAFSRWVSSPVRLFGDLLRQRVAEAGASGAGGEQEPEGARVVMYTQVEELSQVFDAPKESRVVVRARVTLVQRASRRVVAHTTLSVERKAPSPDAAGAVRGVSDASRELAERVVAWVAETLPKVAPPAAAAPVASETPGSPTPRP